MNKSLYGERDYTSGQCILTLRKQLGLMQTGLAFTPDSRSLLSGGEDGSLRLWEALSGELLRVMQGYTQLLYDLAWSPDGTRLASAGSDGLVTGWEIERNMVVSGSTDGRLCWWGVQRGECLRVQEGHHGTVHALKVSPCGNKLASCGDDGAIVLWDLESGKQLQTLRQDRPYERLTITGVRGLTQAQLASLRTLGAVEDDASPGFDRHVRWEAKTAGVFRWSE